MISIVIPTFNRDYIINRALDSVLGQTYLDWECIVVDDGSSDNTESIVGKYVERDSRFKYLKNNRKKGAPGARNLGILASKGDWVVLFDSDNRMHQEFLKKVIETIEKENVDVCSCWSNVINENTEERVGVFKWSGFGDVHNSLLTGKTYFDNSSTIIRRQLLIDIGLLDEECPAFQEWDTHLRLSSRAIYYTIKEFLVDYYTGGSDSISSNSLKDIKGYLFILSKFKDEWRHYHRLSYLKYCSILRIKMDRLKKTNESLEKSYKELLSFSDRIVASFLKCLINAKNAVKR